MSHANPNYRLKANIQAAALRGLDEETIEAIVRNAARAARTGKPRELTAFLKVLQTFGVSKVNPDAVNRNEIATLMGSPTDGLMKRIRPATPPALKIDEVG